jgi:hypothetical protein
VGRSRTTACFALAAYVGAALAIPWLHQAHHEKYGADHIHLGTGILDDRHELGGPVEDETAHAAAHAQMDQALAALHLDEVAYAGTMVVDCAYADFTLVSGCENPNPAHAIGFGDALLSHHHSPLHDHDFDPAHRRSSLGHLTLSVISAPPVLLPPPPAPRLLVRVSIRVVSLADRPLVAATCRGPPLCA